MQNMWSEVIYSVKIHMDCPQYFCLNGVNVDRTFDKILYVVDNSDMPTMFYHPWYEQAQWMTPSTDGAILHYSKQN